MLAFKFSLMELILFWDRKVVYARCLDRDSAVVEEVSMRSVKSMFFSQRDFLRSAKFMLLNDCPKI